MENEKKKCPKCGVEIPASWTKHYACGWEEGKPIVETDEKPQERAEMSIEERRKLQRTTMKYAILDALSTLQDVKKDISDKDLLESLKFMSLTQIAISFYGESMKNKGIVDFE